MNRKGPWEGYSCLLPAFLCAHVLKRDVLVRGRRCFMSLLHLNQHQFVIFILAINSPSIQEADSLKSSVWQFHQIEDKRKEIALRYSDSKTTIKTAFQLWSERLPKSQTRDRGSKLIRAHEPYSFYVVWARHETASSSFFTDIFRMLRSAWSSLQQIKVIPRHATNLITATISGLCSPFAVIAKSSL